jgi:hypothetical protein
MYLSHGTMDNLTPMASAMAGEAAIEKTCEALTAIGTENGGKPGILNSNLKIGINIGGLSMLRAVFRLGASFVMSCLI